MSCLCKCCSGFLKEFKAFLTKGNAFALAIGIIVGNAFQNVVKSLVDDIITPPLGLVIGGVDFVNLTIKISNFIYQNEGPVVIRYGKFIQQLVYLILVGLILFLIITGARKLHKKISKHRVHTEITMEDATPEDTKLLREIRDLLSTKLISQPTVAVIT